MITIQTNDTKYTGQLQLTLCEDSLYGNVSFWEKTEVVGRLSDDLDCLEAENSILYVRRLDGLEDLIQDNKKIKAVILFRPCAPIILQGKTDWPVIVYVQDDLSHLVGRNIEVIIDLSSFEFVSMGNMDMIISKSLDRKLLQERLISDAKKLEHFLDVPTPKHVHIIMAKDICELKMLTGRDSTFSYGNKVLGTVYRAGQFRPEVHEYTHILMFNQGDPPLAFVEGLATITNDILLSRGKKKTFDILAIKTLRSFPDFTIDKLFSFSAYGVGNTAFLYYVAASFLAYLLKEYGMAKVKECYRRLSCYHLKSKNIQILEEIYGANLTWLESNWMKYLEETTGIKIQREESK